MSDLQENGTQLEGAWGRGAEHGERLNSVIKGHTSEPDERGDLWEALVEEIAIDESAFVQFSLAGSLMTNERLAAFLSR